MTATGRSIQAVLTEDSYANEYGNSKNAYRQQQRRREQEFEERLQTTSTPTGRGIQTVLTGKGSGDGKRIQRTLIEDVNANR
jgi:hypothetical protein